MYHQPRKPQLSVNLRKTKTFLIINRSMCPELLKVLSSSFVTSGWSCPIMMCSLDSLHGLEFRGW